jgi:chitin disaccharide deacetylase
MMAITSPPHQPDIRLIVNADDYGYFPCVSQGIIHAAQAGVVGATGILANGPQVAEQVRWLGECEGLDLGIHLNLTSGRPLTQAFAERLDQGRFPGAFVLAAQVLTGRLGVSLVRDEWRAQIETLLALSSAGGGPLRFLNSHEHVHMLPPLFRVAAGLALEYRLPFVRRVRIEWRPPFGAPALLRNLVMGAMVLANSGNADRAQPLFIGLSRSGRLDLAYLKARFAGLRPGSVYELMCHPGLFDPAQITDSRLLAYHDWEGELALLCGEAFRGLCASYGIELTNYRALASRADR